MINKLHIKSMFDLKIYLLSSYGVWQIQYSFSFFLDEPPPSGGIEFFPAFLRPTCGPRSDLFNVFSFTGDT